MRDAAALYKPYYIVRVRVRLACGMQKERGAQISPDAAEPGQKVLSSHL